MKTFRNFAAHAVAAFFYLLVATPLLANDVTTEFDQANKLYEEGKFSAAAEAYEKGLVTRVVPDNQVEEEAYATARRICAGAPLVAHGDTITIVPSDAPITPPTAPIAVDSTRNCSAMWRRAAPRALRRPISPTRSITVTSVTLAMPILTRISARLRWRPRGGPRAARTFSRR